MHEHNSGEHLKDRIAVQQSIDLFLGQFLFHCCEVIGDFHLGHPDIVGGHICHSGFDLCAEGFPFIIRKLAFGQSQAAQLHQIPLEHFVDPGLVGGHGGLVLQLGAAQGRLRLFLIHDDLDLFRGGDNGFRGGNRGRFGRILCGSLGGLGLGRFRGGSSRGLDYRLGLQLPGVNMGAQIGHHGQHHGNGQNKRHYALKLYHMFFLTFQKCLFFAGDCRAIAGTGSQ